MALENTLNPPLAPPSFAHLPTFKRWLMSLLARIRHGKLTIHLDGECYVVGDTDELHASIHIHHPLKLALQCLTKGDLGFGQAYLAGNWSSDNPAALLTLLLRNWHKIGTPLDERGQWLRWRTTLMHWLNRNSVKNSRKNIAHHYDMGNDFYSAWLDPSMTYSSALYTTPELTLEQAQRAKYQRILDELQVQPGQTILEIGCGWGGFCTHAAKHYGCRVTAVTISQEQHKFATERVKREGLDHLVEVRLQDYRHITGQFDKIASIEMLEAVGDEYLEVWFAKCHEVLKPQPGDCCVFCSYGSVPCPPIQTGQCSSCDRL